MLAVTTWILAAGAALTDAQTYSYSYRTEAPTLTPTASLAPTRTETYAPTRMTDAPSYAPTTDTYAPTLGACPPLGVLRPDQCPLDTTGLPPCTDVGLGLGARCVANRVEIAATTTCDRLSRCTPRRLPRVFPTTALDLVFFRRAVLATTRARSAASNPP